jgi:signal transduction histidine kinase
MPAALTLATGSDDASLDVQAETRQLITDLRDAAQDGRQLAARFAEVLTRTVEAYCNEFELRADDLLARLETQR